MKNVPTSYNLDALLKEVCTTTLFQRLQTIVENAQGWHENESVYDHSLKTAKIAKEMREGNFISNEKAKNLFVKFLDEDVAGMKRRDIVVLMALLHDCGKLLSYKEDGEVSSLISKHPKTEDQTTCPGHEYYGGTLVVKEILKDVFISPEIKKYIATVVRLHGSLNDISYYTNKKDWTTAEIVTDCKSRAEGYYIEALFNAYCDCYTAPPFASAKEIIEKLFNYPKLYTKREYFIA